MYSRHPECGVLQRRCSDGASPKLDVICFLSSSSFPAAHLYDLLVLKYFNNFQWAPSLIHFELFKNSTTASDLRIRFEDARLAVLSLMSTINGHFWIINARPPTGQSTHLTDGFARDNTAHILWLTLLTSLKVPRWTVYRAETRSQMHLACMSIFTVDYSHCQRLPRIFDRTPW